MRPASEAENSPPSGFEVQNSWLYISTWSIPVVEFLHSSSFENSVGVTTRFVWRFKRRVLSARVESA